MLCGLVITVVIKLRYQFHKHEEYLSIVYVIKDVTRSVMKCIIILVYI